MHYQSFVSRLLIFAGAVSAVGCLLTAQAVPVASPALGDEASPISVVASTGLPEKTSIPTVNPTSTLPPTPTPMATLDSPEHEKAKPSAAAATSTPGSASIPVVPATAALPTNSSVVQPTLAGITAGQSLSPDGKYTAVVKDEFKVVITGQDGRVAYIFRMKWFRFVGWTADSRYAVMNHYDQYGNQGAMGFDTAQWREFWIPPTPCLWQTNSHCLQGAVKIMPDGPIVVLSDGTSVNLSTRPVSSQDCFAPMFFVWPNACAEEGPVRVQASQQVFERGRMLWVSTGPYHAASEIYVLLSSGDAEIVRDTWTTAEPESDPGIVPPSGRYQPVMGFGKVWRTGSLGTGQSVREALGWAVAPEQGYGSFYQRASSSSGRNLYLFAIDRQMINLFWPQAGTHTHWEIVE